MRIVIWPEQPGEWVEAIRAAAGGTEVIAPTSEAAAEAAAPEAEGWIGRLTPAMLGAAPRLRWLQAPTISLESVVFPELVQRTEITLTNMRHIYDDHIATHVLAVLLALCRDLPRLARRQAERRWDPEAVRVVDPADMSVLVMGLGGIGTEVARRAAVFGPRIIGVDPKVEVPPPGVTELARPDRLPDLLGGADAIIICAPQTPETTGLFDDALFGRVKPGAFFINIGRGKIVRLAALERALQSGRLAGAGLDVFETEPLPADSPLWAMENVIITPHVAGYGPRTEERRLQVVLENVRRFVAGEPLINVADKARWY